MLVVILLSPPGRLFIYTYCYIHVRFMHCVIVLMHISSSARLSQYLNTIDLLCCLRNMNKLNPSIL